MHDPYSEQYRIAGKEHVALKAARDLLRGTQQAVLGQLALKEDGKNITERKMKAMQTQEWADHVKAVNKAEEAANYAAVKVEWIKIKHWEEQRADANARSERRM